MIIFANIGKKHQISKIPAEFFDGLLSQGCCRKFFIIVIYLTSPKIYEKFVINL